VHRDDLPGGDQLGDPAPCDHQDKRRDDRLYADRRNQEPIPGAENQAEADGYRNAYQRG